MKGKVDGYMYTNQDGSFTASQICFISDFPGGHAEYFFSNLHADVFQTGSFLMPDFKCKAKLANESHSLSLFLSLSLSLVPVAMVIWHASRGGQMRWNGGGCWWLWKRVGHLINQNSNNWIFECFCRNITLKVAHGSFVIGEVCFFSPPCCHKHHRDTSPSAIPLQHVN